MLILCLLYSVFTDYILYVTEGVIPFIDSLLSEQELVNEEKLSKNLLQLLIVSFYSKTTKHLLYKFIFFINSYY